MRKYIKHLKAFFLCYYLFLFCGQCANHCLKYISKYTTISFKIERNSSFHGYFATPKLVQTVHKTQERFLYHHCISIKVTNTEKIVRSAEIPLHMRYSLATVLPVRKQTELPWQVLTAHCPLSCQWAQMRAARLPLVHSLPSHIYLYTSVRSPLRRLFSRLKSPIALSLFFI